MVETVDRATGPRVWVYRWPVEVKQARNPFASPNSASSRYIVHATRWLPHSMCDETTLSGKEFEPGLTCVYLQ